MPIPVARSLTKLGYDHALVRRRQKLTQASMGQGVQTSVAIHGDNVEPILAEINADDGDATSAHEFTRAQTRRVPVTCSRPSASVRISNHSPSAKPLDASIAVARV